MQPYYALYQAEQEEGEGEVGAFQVLQVLSQAHPERGEQIAPAFVMWYNEYGYIAIIHCSMIENKIKERAILLRQGGSSLNEISEALNVSKSTASLWLRNLKLPSLAIKILQDKRNDGRKKGSDRQREKSLQRQDGISALAAQYLDVTSFSEEQTKGLCALLYGCEGAKNDTRAAFINSDPELIRFFLLLFRQAFRVDEKKFRVQMHLHEYHNGKQQLRFWADVTGIPKEQFSKVFQKKNGKKNIREGYQGCISVRYNSADIQRELVSVYREILKRGQGVIK